MASTTILPNPKDTKYIDYLSKFKKAAAYFETERTANGKPWPRAKLPDEISYDNFLAEVIDPSTGDYYLTEEGIPSGKYVVDMIIRQKQIDGSEVLVSQGDIVALDYFKDRKVFRADKPEMHIKTIFDHQKKLDPKNRIVRITKGPIGREEVYEMPFTPENLDLLWSKKRDGNIQLIVKSQLNGEPHAVERKGLIRANDVEGAYNMFKTASFEYLYNFEYQKDIPKTEIRITEDNKDKDKDIDRAQPDTKTKVKFEPEKVK